MPYKCKVGIANFWKKIQFFNKISMLIQFFGIFKQLLRDKANEIFR